MSKVLVIKLGALGDVIHAFHAFAAIRAHHRADEVTLLTTAPFRDLAEASPWFDAVATDERAPWWNLPATLRTRRALRGWDMVYDLQTSRRSNRYFRLAGRPQWSGIAPGCAFPHANPARDAMHTIERQREQLAMAGVAKHPLPERGWMTARGSTHGLRQPYAMLIPGGAGHDGAKRWAPAGFGQVAVALAQAGITPVVIGGPGEAEAAGAVRSACAAAVDLTGKTTLYDVAAIAADAALAVGNDTGPLHLAASVGALAVALFSRFGVPAQAAPRGPAGEWPAALTSPDLADLSAERVIAAALDALRRSGGATASSRSGEASSDIPALGARSRTSEDT